MCGWPCRAATPGDAALRLLSRHAARRPGDGAGRMNSLAASASAWPWRGRWRASRACCCSTRPSRRSTSRPANRCTTNWSSCANGCSCRSSWSPTTCARRACWPTASASSMAAATLQDGVPERVMSQPRNARVAALVGLRDIHQGVFHKAASAGGMARLRWGDASRGIDLVTTRQGPARRRQPTCAGSSRANMCSCTRRRRRASTRCRARARHAPARRDRHAAVPATGTADGPAAPGRHHPIRAAAGSARPAAVVHLRIDPQGIHIMPVKRALLDPLA